jgi:hypothetical protein
MTPVQLPDPPDVSSSGVQPPWWSGAGPAEKHVAMLPAVTKRANRLLEGAGRLTDPKQAQVQAQGSGRLLAGALAGIDPITAPPDGRIISAALAYIPCLMVLNDVPDRDAIQLTWARYADAASMCRFGTSSRLWHDAAALHAVVLIEQQLPFEAAVVHRRKLNAHIAHGSIRDVPRARKQFAVSLHASGECDGALHEVRTALDEWRRLPRQQERDGAEILVSYACILAACGQQRDAENILARDADMLGPPGTEQHVNAMWVAKIRMDMVTGLHGAVCTARGPQSRARPLNASASDAPTAQEPRP